MKRKWWMAGTSFALGAVLLAAGGLSAMANTSGYEAYKSALLNTKAQDNLTVKAAFSLTDNGTDVLKGQAQAKWNPALQVASSTVSLSDGTQSREVNVYQQDGKTIVKTDDSDVYRVTEMIQPKRSERHSDADSVPAQPPQAVLQLFDVLAGHMKELATVENTADGGKHAALHMSGSQIPALVNAIGSLAATSAGHHGPESHGLDAGRADRGDMPADALRSLLPQLAENVRVESVQLDADIGADNVLKRQSARIDVTGKDADGVQHELAFQLEAEFTDVNRTVPERIDLTGKQTQTIDPGERELGGPAHGWGWRR